MIRNRAIHERSFYPAVLLGTLALLWPAVWNGYPLLNPDDNTYLLSGFIPDTPFDRPITYGLLLRAGSLNGLSLWPAVVLQCWCVSWLVVRIQLRQLPEHASRARMLYATPLFLSLFSSLAWVTSELIPDISTAVAFLCLILIVLNREHRLNRVVLYALFTVQVATHFSNVMILLLLLGLLFLFRKRLNDLTGGRGTGGRLAILALLSLATTGIMVSALAKSKHVFFTGAMLEQGILQTYLAEHCPTDSLALCAYREQLRPNANWFLWDAESPLYQTGGWMANEREYNHIIHVTLTEPKYIALHIRESLRFTGRQFLAFGVGDGNVPFPSQTTLYQTIHQYLGDALLFRNARQQQDRLLQVTPVLNAGYYFLAGLSPVFIAWVLGFRSRSVPATLKLFVLATFALVLINNWDCATFAQVNGRYGSRVMWLVALSAWLLLPYAREGKRAAS